MRGVGALAVVAGCVVVLVAACGVPGATVGGSSAPDAVVTKPAASPTASGPVPWTGTEAPAAPPNGTVPPPRPQFAPCAAARLAGSPGKPVLTSGLFTWYLTLTNTGTAPCTLNGGPNGVTGIRADGSERTLATGMTTTGAGWFGDLVGPPANLMPGQSAQFAVWTPRPCPANRAYDYTAIEIGIGDTGNVRIRLLDGLPFVACQWLGVSGFGVPSPPPGPPPSPLDVLTVSQTMPATAVPGTTVDYTVTLANPTGAVVALSPCPSYEEAMILPGTQASATAQYYYLNCQAAAVIPAYGSVTFAMEIQAPDGSGAAKVIWQLQTTSLAIGDVVRLTAPAPSGTIS